MRGALSYLLGLVLLLALPMALRPRQPAPKADEEVLIVLSPHNEAIRMEFGRAFADFYWRMHGKRVRVDWRSVGGTSEIARFLASKYLAAFRNHWTKTQPWSFKVQTSFDDPKSSEPARAAFLASNVGCGIDLLFGGGSYDANQQAEAGRLVDCGLLNDPLLAEIPQQLGGELFWDKQGRWVGTALSAFGICYNPEVLARLKLPAPTKWSDLADPRLIGNLALADPTQSGAAAKAFEMLIQEQMLTAADPAVGWENAMRLIRKLAANARYFTDSATKVPLDVESGDAAAGMCIDFYGRSQSQRMRYITPQGGSSVGADPIGLLRGAPHPELAKEFIRFVLSQEGQKLWNYKAGAPGGPRKYALRRLPIQPSLYSPEHRQFLADPDERPYEQAAAFVYHAEWTTPLFRTIGMVVRTMCIDSHDELREAWHALVHAGFPPEAMALFEDVSLVSYQLANSTLRDTMRSPDKVAQVRLARELGNQFRQQYKSVKKLAELSR